VASAGDERGSPRGSRAAWLEWAFTAALAGYACALHHGLGPAPKGAPREWYDPTAFLHHSELLAFAVVSGARAAFCFGPPALLLAAGVFANGRSAVARAIALSCVSAALLFIFYGEITPGPWSFFGWRGSATLWLIAACVGFTAAAPLLAASWLRLDWRLRIAVYLPFAFAVVALVRNATGTNPALTYAISPWPAVPVFGLEVCALFVLATFAGVAIAIFGLAAASVRVGPAAIGTGASAIFLGPMASLCLLALGAWLEVFPFPLGAQTLLVVGTICSAGITGTAVLWLAEGHEQLRRRARVIAIGTAVAGIPLVAGQALARLDYHVTREIQAREIIGALDRYLQRETLYPDELGDLVAAGDLEEVPKPAIGFGFLSDAAFRYQSFGTSFILEFPATRWVECAYTPPYADEEDEGEALGEAWSCPSEPPELW
jgi:hypothetical protein